MRMRSLKLKKYKNIVEVQQISLVSKLFGITIVELTTDTKNRVVSKFSWSGCLSFCIWRVIFYFCAYRAFYEDQTILRVLYNTKLRQYGDVFERVMSVALLTLTLWKMPFHLNLSTVHLQRLLDIDSSIKKMGVKIDYSRDACRLLIGFSLQIFAGTARVLGICIPFYFLGITFPVAWIIQASVTIVYGLILTTHYCNYVGFITARNRIVNTVLTEIKDQKCWERRLFAPTSTRSILQSLDKDKYVCDKMKVCAKTYGLIFSAVESSQIMYGFILVCGFLFCLFYLVLYLFYFMEAIAGGLFHDSQRHTYFVVHIFWHILYGVGVIFLNIYFSECAVEEAKRTSYIVHELINSDISPQITAEAMQFSTQLLHQITVFTACGLCRVDYMLLLKGASSVTTFLVILLQFVMD